MDVKGRSEPNNEKRNNIFISKPKIKNKKIGRTKKQPVSSYRMSLKLTRDENERGTLSLSLSTKVLYFQFCYSWQRKIVSWVMTHQIDKLQFLFLT